MRKPNRAPMRRIVQATALVLAVALVSCDRSDRAKTVSTLPPAVVTGSTAGSANVGAMPEMTPAPAADAAMLSDGASAQRRAVVTAAPAASAQSTPADAALAAPLPALDPTGAMLVRHGQASIEVKIVDDALLSRIRQLAGQRGGFVANTALRAGRDEQRSATLELRVPSAQFDALVSTLGDLGKVESVSVSAEDVAEEYVDLGARLANARRVEARLVEMLGSRTGKLSDVLTVEQELARVRQEAERYEARIRWLERRASLSSLDVTIHERIPLLEPPRGNGPIAEAFAEAWTRMVAVIAWCIASLGVLVPLGILIGLVVLVARRVLRGGTPPEVPQS